MSNRYNQVKTSNRYTPVDSTTTVDIQPVQAAPLQFSSYTTPVATTPAPLAPGPRIVSAKDTFGLPTSTLSQAKPAAPKEDSLWTKAAKVLLPKAAEDYFGLNGTPEKRITPMEAELAREKLKSDQIKLEALKSNPSTAAMLDPNYESPLSKKFKELLNHPAVTPVIAEMAKRTSGTGIVSTVQSIGPKTFTEAYKANKAAQAGDPSKMNQFLYQLSNSGPQTLIGVGLNFIPYAGKPASVAYWTALSASEQIENKGSVTSTTNIGIDVALDSVLGKTIESLFKTPSKALLSTLTKEFSVEGGTEVSQDLLKMGNDYREAKTDAERQAAIQAGKEYFTSGQILMTAGVGGLTGAGIGAGAHVINKEAPQVGQALAESSSKNLGIVDATRNTPVGLNIQDVSTPAEPIQIPAVKRYEQEGIVLTNAQKQIINRAEKSIQEARDVISFWVEEQTKANDKSLGNNIIDNKYSDIVKFEEKIIKTRDTAIKQSDLTINNEVVDTTKSIGELDAQYRATRPGYRKLSEYVDVMLKNGTIFSEEATIIRTLFEGVNDRVLETIKFSDSGRFGANSRYRETLGQYNAITKEFKMQKGLAEKSTQAQASRVFVHEFGHAGWDLILTVEERAIVNKVFNELSRNERTQIFKGSNKDSGAKYYSKTVKEFFAQSFSDYVFENKVPAQQMEPLLNRIAKELYSRLRNLVLRQEVPAVKRMSSIFDKVLTGDNSTPLTKFYNEESPSFKQALQKMFLAPTAKGMQPAEQPTLFKKPATKEVPVETLVPPTEESPAGMAKKIEQAGKQGLPPDIASTIPPIDVVLDGEKRTPITERVRWIDYLRTPWKVFERMGIRPSYQKLLKGYEGYISELPKNIDKITAWSKRVSKEGNEKIFRFLDGETIPLNPEESQVASEIKTWLSQWADRLGMQPDARISDYITHIFPFGKGGEIPEEIAYIINKKIPGSVYNPFLLQRQGAEGYIKNTWAALDAYTKRATRKVNMDPALEELKIASAKLTDTSQLNYLNSYLSAVNLRPTALDTSIDNHIKEHFGFLFGARPTASITRFMRMMISRAKIGGSVTSFAKNLTQGVNTFAELGTWYTTKGYIDLVRFGSKELDENGVLIAPFIEDRTYSAVKKMAERFDKVLFLNMNASELMNRGAAYYGAKSKFLKNKLTNKEFREALGREKPEGYTPTLQDAIRYGKFVSAKTQFLFGPLDTPVGLNSDVAKMAAQFQTFGLKQTEFIGHMLGDHEWRKLIRYLLSSFLLFTYIGSAFGMKWSDAGFPLRWGMPPAIQFGIDLWTGGVMGTDKYGNKLDWGQRGKMVGKSLFTNIVPAGAQMQRTYEGISAVNAGKSTTASGKFQYKIKQSPANYVRGALFGKYNLPENKEYYKKQDEKAKKKSRPNGSSRYNSL